MSSKLALSIAKVKENSSKENKEELILELYQSKYFVPTIIEADAQTHNIYKMGYYSVNSSNGSYLMVFLSFDVIGRWREDVQFLELNYNDVCGILNIESANYAGLLIDNGGNSLSLKKDFMLAIKKYIKIEK